MACSDVQNLYAGDGVTTDFAFTFEYIQQSDVKVALFDSTTEVWDDTSDFTFETATTIRFNSAPPAPPAGVLENVKIYRETALTNLKAVFAAGSAIRAQDLNNNFEQLFFVSQELECYGGGGGIAGGSIDDLVDVNINNPTDGQILEYDGEDWVNVDWHQGNWNETDVNSPSFIQNKPEGGLVYLGLRDCVANNPVGTEIAGNFYVNTADGNASNGWTGIAGDLIENNDRIVLDNDGVTWSRLSVGNSDQPTGGGLDEIFYENGQTVNNDYTLTAGTNAGTFGDVTVDAVVTVPNGSSWTIVGSADGVDPAGFWERDGTTLSPANSGDRVTVGNAPADGNGVTLYSNGGFLIRKDAAGAAIEVFSGSNSNDDRTFVVDENGSAEFSGSVSIGGTDADHTINEYEVGTFSPVYNSGGSGSYSNNEGTYVRVGHVVHFTINIRSTGSDSSDQLRIGNLPFQSAASPRLGCGAWVVYNGDIWGNNPPPTITVATESTQVDFWTQSSNAWAGNSSNGVSNRTLRVAGFYYID